MAYNRMYFFCLQVDVPITGAGVGKLILRHLTVFLLTILMLQVYYTQVQRMCRVCGKW